MSKQALLAMLVAVAGCGGKITGPAVYETQAFGDQQNGFPSPYERALFMAANRARSDPSTVKGPQSTIYPAQAPLALDLDLERSSRFHSTMLARGEAPLMHPSPCTLRTDVATSGCDGDPACGCTDGKTCQSCGTCPSGTDPFVRIGYFHPNGGYEGEIIAAGYGDPWATMDGWVDEASSSDGHRQIVTGASYHVAGFGHAGGDANACWSSFDAGDFAGNAEAPGKIASAAPKPIAGPAGTFRVYATWADPAGGAPASLSAVVDGSCHAMQKELGDEKLNSTWFADVALAAGCHSVYIVGKASTGETNTFPTATAFTIPVAGASCAESLPQPVANCAGPTPPADLGASPVDMSAPSSPDMSTPAPALTVSIDSPAQGSTYPANSAVPISVSTSSSVTSAIANWTRFGVTSTYPLTQTSAGVWQLSLTVGKAGTRSFTVTVSDGSGHSATSSAVTFNVQ